jgi:flagellin
MSISIQTNVASLEAQNFIRVNSNFQSNTIEQLSSGYRINTSADDAAGLAVANQYDGNIAELRQGVLNANNGVSALQIVDGGLSNISTILDRLRTLATESASATFTGDRATLNTEYQGLISEVSRQASNVNLNTGGTYNTNLVTYVGGGSNQPNAQISVDLSGANNAVDSTALGILNTSVAGGGTELTGGAGNSVVLSDTSVSFLAGSNTQNYTFHIGTSTGNQDVTVALAGGSSGLTGQQVVDSLNSQLSAYGINAGIASDGKVQFGGSTAFSVNVGAASGGNATATSTATAVNSADYNLDSSTGTGGAFAPFTGASDETIVFQNAGKSTTVTLNAANAGGVDATQALSTLNAALNSSGIYAVKAANGTDISFQSANTFSVNETAITAGGTGNLFGAVGSVAVTGPAAAASSTGAALAALTALQTAVTNLGLVQGKVGAGENKLNYAVNLAQSQITNYSAAEAGIRDADVAAEAANLTKAQVLQQASLAALAQANSAPQAVLSLLKGG